MARSRISDLALARNLVTHDQIERARRAARAPGDQALGQALLELGFISIENLTQLLSEQISIPTIDLISEEIDPQIPHLLPEDFLRKNNILPFKLEGDVIHVALFPPMDPAVMDEIELTTGYKVEPALAPPNEIQLSLNQHFNTRNRTRQTIVDMHMEEFGPSHGDSLIIDEIVDTVDSPPVVRLVVDIIDGAIHERASDIHLEPQETHMRVRYRIDGMLQNVMQIPAQVQASVISRIKILSGMDITEKRAPQDGHISIKKGDRQFDIRVASFLTINGEKIVMRILSRETMLMDLEKLGLEPNDLTTLKKLIETPHGMILVTGPTGCGKTTSLYSVLNRINSQSENIVTIEDPVEFKLPGINQSQINPAAGLTFANGLRSMLRQDPNVIMVGEIRDGETAEIAVQASLTGHLVLSTLHTSDAPSAITRLVNMGVKEYLISASVIGVIAQRLVRMICQSCKEEYRVDVGELFGEFGVSSQRGGKAVLYRGRGCKFCSNTGYFGRVGIFEIMTISENIKSMILDGAYAPDIRLAAVREGMNTLRHSAFKKVVEGLTTVEEIRRSVFVAVE